MVAVAHTAELRLTEAEVRQAEGVQVDAPVEQVAATVGLQVAKELYHTVSCGHCRAQCGASVHMELCRCVARKVFSLARGCLASI